MSDQPRAFPGRPNLRFLKLEAKRRLAAGEFGTLHDALLAIAREHDLPSWAALKEFVTAQTSGPGPALGQVRWVLSRFAGAVTRAGPTLNWPALGRPARRRGRSPAAGPTWTAARRCTAATASRPTW